MTGEVVQVTVEVQTPENDFVRATVSPHATLEELKAKVLHGLGQNRDPDEYTLEIPMQGEGGVQQWFPVQAEEKVLVVLRGMDRPPRIVDDTYNP